MVARLVVACLLLLGCWLYSSQQDLNHRIEMKKELVSEFRDIPRLPGAIAVDAWSSLDEFNNNLVHTDIAYSTNERYPQIKSHYDKELENHGWQFINEQKKGYEYTAYYKKGDYRAILYYHYWGDDARKYNYTLSLFWATDKATYDNARSLVEMKGSMRNDFRTITPLPGALLAEKRVVYTEGTRNVEIFAPYFSNASAEKVFAHYDIEFINNGWQPVREENKRTIYKKPGYHAYISYMASDIEKPNPLAKWHLGIRHNFAVYIRNFD